RPRPSQRATPDDAPPSSSSGVAPVALLAPRITAVVIAELLPEARLVAVRQPQTAHPLRALPEVQVRDEQTRRTAVLRRQWRTIVRERDPGGSAGDVLERQVRRVAAVTERDNERPLRHAAVARRGEQCVERHTLPF